MIGTLRALWDLFPMFTNTSWDEASNLAFLKKGMGARFKERPQPWVSNISVDDIHSGGFLSCIKNLWKMGLLELLWVIRQFALKILKESFGLESLYMKMLRYPATDPKSNEMIYGFTVDSNEQKLALLYLPALQCIAYGTCHIVEHYNSHGHKTGKSYVELEIWSFREAGLLYILIFLWITDSLLMRFQYQ
ncbi:uncharacterized protein M6B38_289800 [Iris pallida]|uniref:Uncharacterized protein n=1 Tax=Iris pallida TaxID=29817 RepID=A0AAX6HXR1_IRIPA|nr:uncharacterized protein M6B38_289800 [Iris pallida]